MQYVEGGVLSDENPDREYARNVTVMLSIGYVLPSKTQTEDP